LVKTWTTVPTGRRTSFSPADDADPSDADEDPLDELAPFSESTTPLGMLRPRPGLLLRGFFFGPPGSAGQVFRFLLMSAAPGSVRLGAVTVQLPRPSIAAANDSALVRCSSDRLLGDAVKLGRFLDRQRFSPNATTRHRNRDPSATKPVVVSIG
jgi:hypothetical protein